MNPEIFLIASPRLTGDQEKFLASQGLEWLRAEPATEAELLVEFAGRVCYMSFGEGRQSPRNNKQYIKNLVDSGHESVLEHAVWSFLLTGVSRSFTHQLVRHRVGFSYSQLSQQYHDESDADFVLPSGIDPNSDAFRIWFSAVSSSMDAYRKLLSEADALPLAHQRERLRAIRSAARSVLPNATETSIVVTANARALRHFLKVRGDVVGDVEMRLVSKVVFDTFSKEAPALFADFSCSPEPDGFPLVRHA